MITIDLQDDDVVRNDKLDNLDKDKPRRWRDSGNETGTIVQGVQQHSPAKKSLIARLFKMILKDG